MINFMLMGVKLANRRENFMYDKTSLGIITENPLVMDIYNNLNYEIIVDEEAQGDLCAIYFSSNGIYAENTEEEFTRVIIKKNRYEWKNTKINRAKKHIFLRDVTKQMYHYGISKKMNTLHKVIEFLKEETKGYKVVTVGSSSGGYCAVVAGVMLNAEFIYSFTGQFSMYISLFQNPYEPIKNCDFLNKKEHDPEKSQYYNILDTYMKECNIPIFYFTSLQKQDLDQMHLVKGHFNIFTFEMKSDDHRLPVYFFNFDKIINMEPNDLMKIGWKYCDKKISRFKFSVKIMGFAKTFKNLLKQKIRDTKLKIFN